VSTDFEITRESLLEQAKLHATPIDFDDLIERGILQKKGRRYKVLSWDELPEHAKVKIISASSDGTVTFSKATKRAEKLVKQLSR